MLKLIMHTPKGVKIIRHHLSQLFMLQLRITFAIIITLVLEYTTRFLDSNVLIGVQYSCAKRINIAIPVAQHQCFGYKSTFRIEAHP